MKARLLLAPGVLLVARLAAGQSIGNGTPEASARLRALVGRYEGIAVNRGEYRATFVRLHDGGGLQAIVYLRGQGRCGSGGCTMLVLDDVRDRLQITAQVTLDYEPIRLLPISSHGWRDLGVMVQGGGLQKAHEVRLRFGGRHYPGNLTIAPAKRLLSVEGTVVLPAG